MNVVKENLLKMSDQTLDQKAKELIAKWSDPPTALQVLEVLDKCIFYAWSTDNIISILSLMFDMTTANEGKHRDEIIALATWRNV